MSHLCHAHGCEKNVPPKMLMCLKHWRMVPRKLQSAIWATYVPGQENTKDPSARYMFFQRMSVAAVARKEGHEDAALELELDASRWRWRYEKQAAAAKDGNGTGRQESDDGE